MSQYQEILRCQNCEEMTMHISNKPNNILHFLLSVITFGLWFFVWTVILANQESPKCIKCGATHDLITPSKVIGGIFCCIWCLLAIYLMYLGANLGG